MAYMLKRLRVKNFALIENLDLDFSDKFNVLTGETGAGKSIIIGALNLLFGERASSEMFREGAGELFVEGNFDSSDSEEGLIIRREMQRGGRSYVFINDKQVTLQTLRETISGLAELMGQHQHQTLLNPANHVEILDRFGDIDQELIDFRSHLSGWKELKQEIEELTASRRELLQRVDFLKFQLSEIDGANLREDEEEELNRERSILKNATTLKEASAQLYSLLYDDENSIYELYNRCREHYRRITAIDDNFPLKSEDMDNLGLLAEELGRSAASYSDDIEDDPNRLEWIEERLAEIEALKHKYGKDVSAIIEYAREIAGEVDISENFDSRIEELRDDLAKRTADLVAVGLQLGKKREKAAEKLAGRLKESLSMMGMKKMQFAARFEPPDTGERIEHDEVEYTVNEDGLTTPEFFIAPNIGEGLKPLRKIASGGEISRIMLAIKTALAEKDKVRLLIFDEVDTGIGGDIANKVGRLLKELAGSHQVICITHLQQIASLADEHFCVAKKMSQKRTLTFVKKLEGEERISEIARLISGDSQSSTSREFAEKLLSKSDRE
ncbi:MAG: DNA repair protein RecN [candidate division Zixibacteria bacterium]|nr:DNA repair protein RecN [candidate division Zixibacteria bacterium]